MLSLATQPSSVTTRFSVCTLTWAASTKGSVSSTSISASVISSSRSASAGATTSSLTTQRQPRDHHASTPARRMCDRLITWPHSVTTPSCASTSIQPPRSPTASRTVSCCPLTRAQILQLRKSMALSRRSHTASRSSPSPTCMPPSATRRWSITLVTPSTRRSVAAARVLSTISATSPSRISAPSDRRRLIVGWRT
ncbi:hypothetical protein D3C72_1777570 [compost metagenome]